MLKFWKKKSAEPEADGKETPPAAADAAVEAGLPEGDNPDLREALAEIPSPDDTRRGTEPFVAPVTETAETVATPPAKRNWRERLSGSVFSRSLGSLFVRNPRLDDDLLDELETVLITADVGVEASSALVEDLRKRMHKREFADAAALLAALRQALIELLNSDLLKIRIIQPDLLAIGDQ